MYLQVPSCLLVASQSSAPHSGKMKVYSSVLGLGFDKSISFYGKAVTSMNSKSAETDVSSMRLGQIGKQFWLKSSVWTEEMLKLCQCFITISIFGEI